MLWGAMNLDDFNETRSALGGRGRLRGQWKKTLAFGVIMGKLLSNKQECSGGIAKEGTPGYNILRGDNPRQKKKGVATQSWMYMIFLDLQEAA